MPISIQCTECDKKMKVADAVAGKKIRCPACKAVIAVPKAEEEFEQPDEEFETPDEETAVTEAPAPKKKKRAFDAEEPPPKKRKKDAEDDEYGFEEDEPEEEAERRRRKKKQRRAYDDYENHYGELRPARRKQPHRGVLILVLGIVSIFVACLCPLICWIMAGITVSMANTDKAKMDTGVMDRSGQGMTTAGQVCAFVAVLLGVINAIAGVALRATGRL